jgi:hypothetical protein
MIGKIENDLKATHIAAITESRRAGRAIPRTTSRNATAEAAA